MKYHLTYPLNDVNLYLKRTLHIAMWHFQTIIILHGEKLLSQFKAFENIYNASLIVST